MADKVEEKQRQAMDVLDIPEEHRGMYLSML